MQRVTLLSMLEMALRRPLLVIGLPLLLAVLVGGIGLARPRTYTSSAQFVPQATGMAASRMAGLAAQFGVSVPGADASQSPDAYAALVTSRGALEALVDSTYRFTVGANRYAGNLVQLYHPGGSDSADRREQAIKDLQKNIAVDVGLKTGIVGLKVRARWAPLAEEICHNILSFVNAHNLTSRQAQARAEQQFYNERLQQAGAELRSAENELQDFSLNNRSGTGSPRLALEVERLRRVISMRQQVYTSLVQMADQANIDAMHNTPVISVVDPPFLPHRPDPRYLALKVALALLGGFVLACAIGISLDKVDTKRRETPEVFARLSNIARARWRS